MNSELPARSNVGDPHDFRGEGFRTKQPVIEFLRDHGFDIIERRDDPRPYVRDHIHGVRKKL